MKQGVPWSVKGVRTEARDAAKKAAHESGQTLGQWLNAVIAEKSELDGAEGARGSDGSATIPGDIGEVMERAIAETRSGARVESSTLTALDSVARWMETVDSRRREDTRHLATIQERTSEGLRSAIDRVVRQVDSLERRVEEVKTAPIAPLSEKLDQIATRLDQPDDDPKLTQRIEVTLKDIDSRFSALASKLAIDPASPATGARAPQALDDVDLLPSGPPLPAQERLARAVAEIQARQADLGELDRPRFEPRAAKPPHDAADKLMDEVAALGRKLDKFVSGPAPEPGPRLDDIVSALREHLPALPSLNAFDARLERIGAQIESLSKQTAAGESLDRLGRELAEIRGLVDLGGLRRDIAALGEAGTAGSDEAVVTLQHMLGEIKEAIRAPAWDSAAGRIAALEAAIADLPRQIALTFPASAPTNIAPLEQRLQTLLRRIETKAEAEPADLAEMSRKIDDIAGRLEQADESFKGITRLERSVADLLIRVDQERREADKATDSDRAQAERRIEETLSGLRETLGRLADRLTSSPDMQGSPESAALGMASLPPEPPPPSSSPKSLAEKLAAAASAAEAARAMMSAPTKDAVRPSARLDALKSGSKHTEPDRSESARSASAPEPRSIAQDQRGTAADQADPPIAASQLVAAARAAAARTAGGGVPVAAQESPAKRESPIQSLRGQAQAAQADAGVSEADKAKPASRLAGLQAFTANRRRPLIIGAAALIAALGAGSVLIKQFSGESAAPEAAVLAPAEQDRGEAAATPESRLPTAPDRPGPGGASDAGKASGASQLFDPAGIAHAAQGFAATPSVGLTDPVSVGAIGGPPRSFAAQAQQKPSAQSFNEPIPAGLPAALARALEIGDPLAAYDLALRYFDGRSAPKDAGLAALWMEKAASRSYAPAQYRLGSLYEKGQGVAKDRSKARVWYEKAATAGNVKAMHNLGVLLAEGEAGKPDFAAAAYWFRQGAEAGLKDSQYNLAILAARGLGMQQNLPQSFMWFSLAAAQGDEDAARKREEVAAKLDPTTLASAKSATLAFRAKPADQAANEPAAPAAASPAAAPRKDASRQNSSGI